VSYAGNWNRNEPLGQPTDKTPTPAPQPEPSQEKK